jgi:hypothetical protein
MIGEINRKPLTDVVFESFTKVQDEGLLNLFHTRVSDLKISPAFEEAQPE